MSPSNDRPDRWLYRLVHVDNLPTLLQRGGLHAPNATPDDGLPYRTIHNTNVQENRRVRAIPCGPRGTIHDYVPFYFGPLSVMLLKAAQAGRVPGAGPLALVSHRRNRRPERCDNGNGRSRTRRRSRRSRDAGYRQARMVLLTREWEVIRITDGNLLEAPVEALVNTVNCVGYMGKGIALQFKQAFPANFRSYEAAAKPVR